MAPQSLLGPCLPPTVPQPYPGRNAHPSEAHSLDGRNRSSHQHSCDTGAGTGAGDSLQLSCAGKHIHRGLEDIPEGRVKFLPVGDFCHGSALRKVMHQRHALKTKSSPGYLELQAFLFLSLFFWGVGEGTEGEGERES